jgi:hypothetical protein
MSTHLTTMTPEALETFAGDLLMNEYAARRLELIFPKFVTRESTSDPYVEMTEISGLGTLALVAEGQPVPFDTPVQGNKVRVPMLKFGLGYRVTEEMREDEKWGVVERLVKDLNDAAMDHMDRFGHDVINNAFASTNYSTLDGVALCSASHTGLKNGGATRSNLVSPAVDVSEEGIESMVTLASLLTDDQGRYIPFNPTELITHTNNRFETERILQSERRVGSADNDRNIVNTLGISPVYSPYLTDTDAFFMRDKRHKNICWYDRRKPTPRMGTDLHTNNISHILTYRANTTVFKFEGFFGSQGA